MRGAGSAAVVVSCEHASNRLPRVYRGLGLAPDVLGSHIAWDPGAAVVARVLSRILDAPLYEGAYSRLLIDLNRSPQHPRLVPRRGGNVEIPGNVRLESDERQRRIERYYRPYHDSFLGAVGRIVDGGGRCVHLSVHSFVPVLDGVERRADVGVLYEPGRERVFAGELVLAMRAYGWTARRNFPYRGVSDGLTSFCRRRFGLEGYLGIEIEVNQALLGSEGKAKKIGRQIGAAVGHALECLGSVPRS